MRWFFNLFRKRWEVYIEANEFYPDDLVTSRHRKYKNAVEEANHINWTKYVTGEWAEQYEVYKVKWREL